MQIENSKRNSKTKSVALLALGFRPFFLLAGLAAVMLILVWLMVLEGKLGASTYYPGKLWHAHEMLFGYVAAVVAGFLLTAVKNWTGVQTQQGMSLLLIALLWIAGRLAPFVVSSQEYNWIISLVDFSFFPVLAVAIALPITSKKQASNYIFPALLILMSLANGLTHLQFLGLTSTTATVGNQLMLYLVLTIIIVMGGRVIPFFTERGVAGVTTSVWPWCEKLGIASIVLLACIDSFWPNSPVLLPVALLAAATHGIRVYGWYDSRIWRVPMVWILQMGYAWMSVGMLLLALVSAGLVLREHAIHALTTGVMGLITFGMMARVALGHSGREISADRYVVSAFILIAITPLIRVILPIIFPDLYLFSLRLSGGLWIAAFLIFVIRYMPILFYSRIDGRPG
ncbi:MAG: NnrS family protein [Gammaproteobacteria bacterium]|nr:NnrS family protein [Gammaproteobacteria bacterium]